MKQLMILFLFVIIVQASYGQDLTITLGDTVELIIYEVTGFENGSPLDDNGIILSSLRIINPDSSISTIFEKQLLEYDNVGKKITQYEFQQQVGLYYVVLTPIWFVSTNPEGSKENSGEPTIKNIKVNQKVDDRKPGKHRIELIHRPQK